MIITCPQCDIRFVVPSTIFMRGGRKLRCSSCKHTWMQDEPLEKKEQVSPVANNDDSSKQSFLDKIKQDFTQGYKIIGGVCALVLIAFFIYKFLTPSLIIGQGLAFDNIAIERDGTTLNVTGEIVNAMDSDRGVPSIQITRILADNIEGDATLISPDKMVLHSGETLPIQASLDNIGADIKDLKITFKVE